MTAFDSGDGDPRESLIRLLRWTISVLVAVVLTVVVIRVSRCLGNDLCTFAPGALQIAVLAFVGGPALVAVAWLVPVVVRRRRSRIGVGVGLMVLALTAVVVGVVSLGSGGPAAAVVPSLAPALGLAGLMVVAAASDDQLR